MGMPSDEPLHPLGRGNAMHRLVEVKAGNMQLVLRACSPRCLVITPLVAATRNTKDAQLRPSWYSNNAHSARCVPTIPTHNTLLCTGLLSLIGLLRLPRGCYALPLAVFVRARRSHPPLIALEEALLDHFSGPCPSISLPLSIPQVPVGRPEPRDSKPRRIFFFWRAMTLFS